MRAQVRFNTHPQSCGLEPHADIIVVFVPATTVSSHLPDFDSVVACTTVVLGQRSLAAS